MGSPRQPGSTPHFMLSSRTALNPKSILGGSAPETLLPPGIVKKYPALVGLTTVGDSAQAARAGYSLKVEVPLAARLGLVPAPKEAQGSSRTPS